MSVGLLVVRLKYGLYVGHLSKWFVFVLCSIFSRLFHVCTVVLHLPVTSEKRLELISKISRQPSAPAT